MKKPSLLGYKRAIESTNFAMFALDPTDKLLSPVEITESTVRGTIANYSDKVKPADRVGIAKNAVDGANVQKIEIAFLPVNASTMVMKGSIRFNSNSFEPSMHDSLEFTTAVNAFLTAYSDAKGYDELALRYLLNAASGRWMWRNWDGEDRQVTLKIKGQGSDSGLTIHEDDIDMSKGFHIGAIKDEAKREEFQAMVNKVSKALGHKAARSVAIELIGSVDLGFGAEVYPSQEFSSADEKSDDKGGLSKILARSVLKDGTKQAVLHTQKIGNAIRTIDTWYKGPKGPNESDVAPIAVEPFGANTHMKVAHRVRGNDLYTYFADPEALQKSLTENGVNATHHFVAACLVRGGAYQMGNKPK